MGGKLVLAEAFAADGALATLGADGDADAATRGKLTNDLQPDGVERGFEVAENVVDEVLLETALVAKRPEIELQRFALDDARPRNVADGDDSKVWLPRGRAKTRELLCA